MNEHHTKTKGDLAVAIVIADLTKKGYGIFLHLSEHLPIDLIAYKDEKCFRIQCKYSADGELNYKSILSIRSMLKMLLITMLLTFLKKILFVILPLSTEVQS
jgi:hypothetical protein